MYYSSDSDESGSEIDGEFAELLSWKWELGQSIETIQTFGDVAWSKQYQHIVLPGLEVGGTPIPLPLATPRDADVIRKACHQAPFGRGNKTVVDESVRKTWEIGCEGFKLSNPLWPSFVKAILGDASVPLSLPPGVRAEPYKLLLYDPGSFFKPHKDSEKVPGMIATLVICLPSAHQGGEVHISQKKQKHVLATSQASAFDVTALVWYSDVTHEVMETTSGHRLVLTYNIILDKNQSSIPLAGCFNKNQSNIPSAGGFNIKQERLETHLKFGHTQYPMETRLLYPLSHQYSPTSLSIHNMKGVDRARVYALRKACASSEYLLLLANTSRITRYGEPDDDIYQLTYVATCDGAQVGADMDFNPDFIGDRDPYIDERYPDSEVEEEHLGNQEAAPEFIYHDSAAILVRQDDLLGFLPVEYLSLDTVAHEIAKLISESSCARTSGAELLKGLVKPPKRKMSKTLSEILSFAITTGDRDLWDEVFGVATVDFGRIDPRSGRYREDFHLFGRSDVCRNAPTDTWEMGCLTPVLSKFAMHLNEDSMGRLEGGCDEHLGKMVLKLHPLENVEKALDSLAKNLKRDDIKQSLRTWRASVAETRFNQPNSRLKWNDSSTIMSLLQREKGLDWMNNSLLPALKGRADKSLLLTLLPTLLDHADNPDMKTIAKKIYWDTMSQLKVDASDFGPAFACPYSTWNRQPEWLVSTRDLSYEDSQVSRFMILAKKFALHEFGDEVALLVNNCCCSVAEAHEGPVHVKPKPSFRRDKHVSTNPHLLVEYFLKDVLSVVEQSERPTPRSLKSFLERLVRHYILSEIPPWPKKVAGWAHRPRNCNRDSTYQVNNPRECMEIGACKELNEFLKSETEPSRQFQSPGESYYHFRKGLLPSKHFRLETVGDGRGPPSTLVVTKLGTEYQEDLEMHKAEIQKLEKRLLAFRTPFVKAVLGDELYAELVLLSDIRKPPGTDSGTLVPLSFTEPSAEPSGPAQEPGTKRPASGDIEQAAASRMRLSGAN